jgi:hypothetical protein
MGPSDSASAAVRSLYFDTSFRLPSIILFLSLLMQLQTITTVSQIEKYVKVCCARREDILEQCSTKITLDIPPSLHLLNINLY